MTIAVLAAGAGGMYCGSCLRDNALSTALRRLGHDAVMIPLYTPVKTDAPSASSAEVFYGGINTWLQHASRFFRKTPRAMDWLLDRPWLLSWAGTYGSQTPPAQLGELTIDVLRGEGGNTAKELHRLVRHLKEKIRPQVVSLPNLMFIGAARTIKAELKSAVVVELTGEDIFLDALAEPHKIEARRMIRERAGDVDRFIATSRYYADHVASALGLPRERIDVVYPGIAEETFSREWIVPIRDSGPRVGYMARICPEKGIDRLIEAALLLQEMEGMEKLELHVAGYMGKAHAKWFDALERRIKSRLRARYRNRGEVDLRGKLMHLDEMQALCVPTAYPEPKGIYVLEGWARGVPCVLPAHGAFVELLEMTGGGIAVPPGDTPALAGALAELLRDRDRCRRLGAAGQAAVRERFMDVHMAEGMVAAYGRAISEPARAG